MTPADHDEMLAGVLTGMEQDRAAVLATMRMLLEARLAEGELTPDERLQAQLLLREIADAKPTDKA